MKIHYTVHSAVLETIQDKVMHRGVEIIAPVPVLVVEGVSHVDGTPDELHGHTFRFVAPSEETKALFQVGNKVRADFTLEAE